MFAATEGSFLGGVKFVSGGAQTHSVVMRSKSGSVRLIDTTHRFDTKPTYSWATGLDR